MKMLQLLDRFLESILQSIIQLQSIVENKISQENNLETSINVPVNSGEKDLAKYKQKSMQNLSKNLGHHSSNHFQNGHFNKQNENGFSYDFSNGMHSERVNGYKFLPDEIIEELANPNYNLWDLTKVQKKAKKYRRLLKKKNTPKRLERALFFNHILENWVDLEIDGLVRVVPEEAEYWYDERDDSIFIPGKLQDHFYNQEL